MKLVLLENHKTFRNIAPDFEELDIFHYFLTFLSRKKTLVAALEPLMYESFIFCL